MKTVFVAIEENSPELRSDCGAYNLMGVYSTWEKALKATETWRESNFNVGYFSTGEANVDHTNQTYYNIVYRNGDTDSDLWTELRIKPVSVQ